SEQVVVIGSPREREDRGVASQVTLDAEGLQSGRSLLQDDPLQAVQPCRAWRLPTTSAASSPYAAVRTVTSASSSTASPRRGSSTRCTAIARQDRFRCSEATASERRRFRREPIPAGSTTALGRSSN